MNIIRNISLKPYNTFGIDATAAYFSKANNVDDLKYLLSKSYYPTLILGGGSNVLFTKDYEGLVILIANKKIEIISENKREVIVRVAAGELWHDLVLWAVNNNLGGLENLALIPGSVGAAPVQNIGAYGRELKDVMHSCHALDKKSLENITYEAAECQFGYRDSIFKKDKKGSFIIHTVDFILQKPPHRLHIDYGYLQEYLSNNHIKTPAIADVMAAVVAIRQSKLPNPRELGNAGSFFKNPIINKTHFNKILQNYTEFPHYKITDTDYKIPAAWLIEQSGYKGLRVGQVGVHDKQALVLVNYGQGTGKELFDLSKQIQIAVYNKFGIEIEREVTLI